MASIVQICNLALVKMGGPRVQAVFPPEGTEAARICNVVWDLLRDEVMESSAWTFAVSRKALAQLATAPDFGYIYAYQLPADYLKAIHLEDPKTEYVVEGDSLLTDVDPANLHYIKQVVDPAQFSPSFIAALTDRMAIALYSGLTKSPSGAALDSLWTKYRDSLAHGAATNASSNRESTAQPSSYVDARS